MRTQIPASDDIDIASLWSVMRRHGLKIAAFAAAMGLLTLGSLSLVPSRYTAETKIQIGGQGISDSLRNPNLGANQPQAETHKVDKEAIASQVVALGSRDLAQKVAAALRLAEREEFNGTLGGRKFPGSLLRALGLTGPRPGESAEESVLASYARALRIYQVKDTRVITIEFTSQDNELAANAANQLAEIYQDWLRSIGLDLTEDASQWLRPQIEKLSKEVVQAESAVERFRSQANLFRGGSSGGGLNEQQLSDLSSEVTKARSARSEAEARARSARELVQRGLADAIAEVQKSPVIQGLIAQRTRAEREKAEAETSLLAGHPRMKQLNANVADLRRQVTKEATLIVEGLEKEAKALALREELAAKNLDEKKKSIGLTANDIAKLSALEGDAKAKRRELDDLQQKLQAAEGRKDPRSVPLEAQIISRAHVSTLASSPKRVQHAALAAVAGLILGFALVILKELFRGGQRGGSARPAMGANGAGPGPTLAAEPVPPRRAAPTMPTASGMAEAAAAAAFDSTAIDPIARRLVANAGGQGGYRTVITSGTGDVAPAQEAVALTAALAAGGRQVALVDWSLDGRGIGAGLGIAVSPGLTDLIGGVASFEDVIRRIPDGAVHVVACGNPAVPGSKLEADRINLVLDALDEAYDHIVVAGAHDAIRELFLAIQGRFDAGIVVAGAGSATDIADGVFLGFQVTDIDVIRIERATAPAPARRRKMQLARGPREALA